jgi:hypothetical protein
VSPYRKGVFNQSEREPAVGRLAEDHGTETPSRGMPDGIGR